MPNLIAALISFLSADTALDFYVAGRIFGEELPESAVAAMPRDCIVVKTSGGAGAFGAGWQEFGDRRVDLRCYGPTPLQANLVSDLAYVALKQMHRSLQGDCLLHWARIAGGPQALRDPDTDWPFALSSWQVLAAEIAA